MPDFFSTLHNSCAALEEDTAWVQLLIISPTFEPCVEVVLQLLVWQQLTKFVDLWEEKGATLQKK